MHFGSVKLSGRLAQVPVVASQDWQTGQLTVWCAWAQAPASQPGFVHFVPSVSVQRVSVKLSGRLVHVPLVASHCWQVGHVTVWWVWTHCPASHPGFVHAVPSVSVQRVSVKLSGTAVQVPLVASHC